MYNVNCLVTGNITLKNGNKQKHISGNVSLSDEDAVFFADELVRLQKSNVIFMKQVQDDAPAAVVPDLTPEQKADKKDEIKAQLLAFSKEYPTANEERKEQIKLESAELKKQAKEL